MSELIHGDCLIEMDNLIGRGVTVDAVICDLPYEVTNNVLDKAIPFPELWKRYNKIVKEDGNIILFAQGLFYVDMVNSNRAEFRYDLVWDKILTTGFLNANRMPLRSHEQIAVFYKKLGTYNPQMTKGAKLHGMGTAYKTKETVNNNYGKFEVRENNPENTDKYPKSILTYQKPHPSVAKHRTEKSIPLLEWLVKTYTNEGDTVLDNTCGSGTTLLACMNTKREYIGIEKDEEYYKVSMERIKFNAERLKSESFKRSLF